MVPFQPLFRNPHLQTIASHFWKRADAPGPIERRHFETEPGVQVLVETVRPEGRSSGHLVLVHGLESSSEAGYMRGFSAAGVENGFTIHRFHLRTCGGTEHLCDTLYHAGLTSDLFAYLRELCRLGAAPVFLIGFSLGGNVVLKLTGELGAGAPPLISGVCAASSPLDLAESARRIGERDNWLYHWRFVRRMRARLYATGRYSEADLAGLATLQSIDDRITAPAFGFAGASDYYNTQSALRYLGGIQVPALLVQAKDDTFIPFKVFESEAVRSNPRIRLLATEHGGHLGFIGRGRFRFWLEHAILAWIAEIEQNGSGTRSST
jgi:predicted alpha/beta-fold hydrolase